MRGWCGFSGGLGAIAVVCLGLAGPVAALAQAEREVVTAADLREELAKRDAIIIELLNRIESLESERDAAPSETSLGQVEGGTVESRAVDTAQGESVGELVVDELRAERALERGLVERGARLLAPGQIEVVPRFSFSLDEGRFPIALMNRDGNDVGEVIRTSELFEGRADVRFGLPLGLQMELGIPYLSLDQEGSTGINGAIETVMEQSGSGLGDATLSLAKGFVADSAQGATVIGRLAWLSGSGDERDGSVFLGAGNAGLNLQATAYWRRDPVVFLMSGGYTQFEETSSLQRGDSVGLSLGLGLAVSPETALIFSLDQTRSEEFRREGIAITGTERRSSSLGLSTQTLLGRRFSLGVNVDMGLSDDAADYRFGVSLSSRFSAR